MELSLSGGGHGPSKAGPQSWGRWATTNAAASRGVSTSPKTPEYRGAYTVYDCVPLAMNGRSLLHGNWVFLWKVRVPWLGNGNRARNRGSA